MTTAKVIHKIRFFVVENILGTDIKERLSWQEYALEIAKTAAKRSEDPHRKVGACALDRDRMILGVGYNGLAPKKKVDAEFWLDRDERRKFMIHAEANCMSLFNKGQASILAVTLLPCSHCATLIAAYKIPQVIYSEEYEQDLKAKEILDFYGVELVKI